MNTYELALVSVGTVIGKEVGNFVNGLIFDGKSSRSVAFTLTDKVNGSIGYDASLNLQERNFHLTLDFDLNF